MKIKYVGPFPSVRIDATGQDAERGVAIDVDDEVAKSLLKQDFEKVTDKKDKE